MAHEGFQVLAVNTGFVYQALFRIWETYSLTYTGSPVPTVSQVNFPFLTIG
jgi:hypothetical protein